jgi:AcrR family transcriptional regulator
VTNLTADGDLPPSARNRTFRLLVNAAREQLREGAPMTVAAVASRAHVSRATAYRYFSNNEGVLLAATVPADQPSGLPLHVAQGEPPDDLSIPERAAILVRDTAIWAFSHETELRAVLALTLSPDSKQHGVTRKGITNRGSWITKLLDELPPSVPEVAKVRLHAALVPLFGADAVVWTTDVAEFTADEAPDLLAWMAYALTSATIAAYEVPTPSIPTVENGRSDARPARRQRSAALGALTAEVGDGIAR